MNPCNASIWELGTVKTVHWKFKASLTYILLILGETVTPKTETETELEDKLGYMICKFRLMKPCFQPNRN